MEQKSKTIMWIIISTAIGTIVGMTIRTLLDKFVFKKLGITTAARTQLQKKPIRKDYE